MKKALLLFTLLCLASGPAPARPGGEIKIGAIFAKTGIAASVDRHAFEAARFAAAEINADGGLLGDPVMLQEWDGQSTPLGARQAARDAVEQGVTGVIGFTWSSQSLAAAPVFQEAGIPMITPTATNPEVTLIGDCIFRTCCTDAFQGRLLARFAQDHLKAETAVILANTSQQYSRDLSKHFALHFNARGRVLWEGDYLQETTDFSFLLEKTAKLAPDIVFAPGYARDAGFLLRQAGLMGRDCPFLGGDGWNYTMKEYAGDAVNGHFFSEQWHRGLPWKNSQSFVKLYEAAHDPIPLGGLALTYDAVMLMADAVQRAGAADRGLVREALAKTKGWQGVTGTLTFDENGDPEKSIVILQFVDGQPQCFMTAGP